MLTKTVLGKAGLGLLNVHFIFDICLVPNSYGFSYNFLKGVDLWEVYNTLMPRQRHELEKKFKSPKRVS